MRSKFLPRQITKSAPKEDKKIYRNSMLLLLMKNIQLIQLDVGGEW